MCRRTLRAACLAAGLVALVTGSAPAQETAPASGLLPAPATAAQLRARLAVLQPRIDSAVAVRLRDRAEAAAARAAETSAEPEKAAGQDAIPATLPGLRRWVGRDPFTAPVPDATSLFRHLALSPSTLARACAGGEAQACAGVLGWPADDDERVPSGPRRWYDPAAARGVVAALAAGTADWDRSDVRACDDQGGDACYAVLGRWDELRTAPGGATLRLHVARFALELGGDEARTRMAALPPGAPAPALLAAAAGVEPAELLALWMAGLRAARPDRDGPGERRDRGTALAWASLFAFLAMTNTRWRLGR